MNNEQLFAMRHSSAHLAAAAIEELFLGTLFGVGPVVADGFYYDVKLPDGKMLGEEDLIKIEEKMRELQSRNLDFIRSEMSIDETIAFFAKRGQVFKVELLQDLKTKGTTSVNEDETQDLDVAHPNSISLYATGSFVDLCRGPHIANTKEIGAFKIVKLAGAYWRGKAENPQLQRVYGVVFETQKELDAHITMIEEAKKRDHRVLGRELDLFVFSDLVGAGLALWTPKGTILRNELDTFVWELRKKAGYERVSIPHITRKELYETSGHWEKFSDELFKIVSREGHEFAMKPMNCPHHTQIYASHKRSYRELPQRYAETTMCYRDEQSGELHGLSRVRGFTQDDAHIFCRTGQIKQEFFKVWDIIDTFYSAFGFELTVRLSLHDPKHPEKYLGGSEVWKSAETSLRELAMERGVAVIEAEGEAAMYGPKIDFITNDSLGRSWQVATIQLDMNLPDRFDLQCINEEGKEERIVMIHAAIMGSLERFSSLMIEHFAGAFPVWLSPVQVAVLAVADLHRDHAETMATRMKEAGLRVWCEISNDTLGAKIRKTATQKIPYTIVLGDREIAAEKLPIRVRGKKDLEEYTETEFIEKVQMEIRERTR